MVLSARANQLPHLRLWSAVGLESEWHEQQVPRLGGVVVSMSDSWPRGGGFDSRPVHLQATTLGKLLSPMCLCHQAVQFGTGQITDFSGLSTYGLKGYEGEMSTPPTLRRGMVDYLYLLPNHLHYFSNEKINRCRILTFSSIVRAVLYSWSADCGSPHCPLWSRYAQIITPVRPYRQHANITQFRNHSFYFSMFV